MDLSEQIANSSMCHRLPQYEAKTVGKAERTRSTRAFSNNL